MTKIPEKIPEYVQIIAAQVRDEALRRTRIACALAVTAASAERSEALLQRLAKELETMSFEFVRQPCTEHHAMPKDASGRWVHTGAYEVGSRESSLGGDIVYMRCVHCGAEWSSELPQ